METIVIAAQLLAGLGIYNVWLLRNRRPTGWRGGNARNLQEEFEVYGLSHRLMQVIGLLKLTFATMLIAGIWVPSLVVPAALGLAALMVGAVLMHVKVRDPLKRALPAATVLALCLFVAAMHASVSAV